MARFSYSRRKCSIGSPDWSPKNGALLERGAGIATGPVAVAIVVGRWRIDDIFVGGIGGRIVEDERRVSDGRANESLEKEAGGRPGTEFESEGWESTEKFAAEEAFSWVDD